jgi:hypothetical protein
MPSKNVRYRKQAEMVKDLETVPLSDALGKVK